MYEFKHTSTATFEDYLARHLEWGHATFGSPADGRGPLGPLDHLKKEVKELADAPHDLEEWTDAIILSIDGFLRAGGKITQVLPSLLGKQNKNAARDWPDWTTADPTKAIEHVRTPEELAAKATAEGEATAEAAVASAKVWPKTKKKAKPVTSDWPLKGGSNDDR